MKLSARNTLKDVKTGTVNTEVVVLLAGGEVLVSIITKESAEKLGLKPGKDVCAVIKASNVMIGTD